MARLIRSSFCVLRAVSLLLGITGSIAQSVQAAPASSRDEHYVLPLVNGYSIARRDLGELYKRDELYRLLGDFSGSERIHSLINIAVSGKVIVGETIDQFFILDTAHGTPTPQFYKTREAWQAALVAGGLSKDISLISPDVLAAALSNRTIRPWEYRMMKGFLGCSDGDWEGFLVISGWLLAFIVGWCRKKRTSLLPLSILIGLFTNVVGRIILGGGGGPAFVGFFVEPLWCWLMATIGWGIRTALTRRLRDTSKNV